MVSAGKASSNSTQSLQCPAKSSRPAPFFSCLEPGSLLPSWPEHQFGVRGGGRGLTERCLPGSHSLRYFHTEMARPGLRDPGYIVVSYKKICYMDG